ncbi:MAG: FHA domain-containing protein [Gammaproteobacteria bacterium]|nr:FHA domain-containing protein [Gammaproteobacteria bacterium]
MATIQISFNGEVESELQLNKETMSIGRKSDNDIHLDNLAVSGHHAKILTILNDSFIEDLNSTNGTYLNGSLVKKNVLTDGDLIKVGKHEIKYINANTGSANDFEKTMIINPDSDGMQETEGSKEIDQSVGAIVAEITSSDSGKSSQQKAKIRLVSGPNSGRELPLTKVLTTLGKPGVQVAAITRRPTGYFLIHIDGGDNGERPRVNDSQIGSKAHPLSDNDSLEVAGVKMTFFFE